MCDERPDNLEDDLIVFGDFVPYPIIRDLVSVLARGSRSDGHGILTHNKSYCYYTYKLIKHLLRGMLGFKYDHDSGKSHFAHAVIRLMQVWWKYKMEKEKK